MKISRFLVSHEELRRVIPTSNDNQASTPLEFKEGSLSLLKQQNNNNGFDASVEVSGGFDLRQFVVSGS